MKRLMIALTVLSVFSTTAFAQMGNGQGGGMMTGGSRWGMGTGWNVGILITIVVVIGIVYFMMKRKKQ